MYSKTKSILLFLQVCNVPFLNSTTLQIIDFTRIRTYRSCKCIGNALSFKSDLA